MKTLNSSSTTTDGTRASKLLVRVAHAVPQSSDTLSAGSTSHPIACAAANKQT